MGIGGGPNLRVGGCDFCLTRGQWVVESGNVVGAGEGAKTGGRWGLEIGEAKVETGGSLVGGASGECRGEGP